MFVYVFPHIPIYIRDIDVFFQSQRWTYLQSGNQAWSINELRGEKATI